MQAYVKPAPIIFPGSFNPIHQGHRTIVKRVQEKYKQPVHYELCIHNTHKPSIETEELNRRLSFFEPGEVIWVTEKAFFFEKCAIFPKNTRFIIGDDTFDRILHHFDNEHSDELGLDIQLHFFKAQNTKFEIIPREHKGKYRDTQEIMDEIPDHDIFQVLEGFRLDMSSTDIRKDNK